MIPTVRLPADAYRISHVPVYHDLNKLHALFDKVAFESNCILVGPKGVAKTLSVVSWAAAREIPIVTFDCSEDVRRGHLYGHCVLQGDESPFVLGPIPTAFEIANEVGTCILALEEINALTPQMQKTLNAPTDFRAKLELPECGRVFQLEDGAKLWFVGTMNTSVYGGVYELNEDLKSRWSMIDVDYPSTEDEKKVLDEVLATWNVPAIKVGDNQLDLKDGVLALAHETRQQAMDYSLSTRDVVQILRNIQLAGLNNALWMAMGKFEGEDKTTFYKRMKSIFGSKVLGNRAPKKG